MSDRCLTRRRMSDSCIFYLKRSPHDGRNAVRTPGWGSGGAETVSSRLVVGVRLATTEGLLEQVSHRLGALVLNRVEEICHALLHVSSLFVRVSLTRSGAFLVLRIRHGVVSGFAL